MWYWLTRFESLLFYFPFLVYALLFHFPLSFRCRNCRKWLFQWEDGYRGLCEKCAHERAKGQTASFYEETYKKRIGANVALTGHVYSALKVVGPGRVLDVGCGTGFMVSGLQAPDREMYGIDISASAIKMASSSVGTASFCVADIREIPFKSNSFDWLICIDTLEHIEGDETIKECFRILKPGGKALLSAPNKSGPGDGHVPGHVHSFSFASFEKHVEQVGFEITRARKMVLYIPILTYTCKVLSLALKKDFSLANGLDIPVPEFLAANFFIEARKPPV